MLKKEHPKQQTLSDEELKIVLKRVVWDYNISPDDLLAIFKGEMEGRGVNMVQLKSRLLNSYSWYQLLDMFGYDGAVLLLKDEIIQLLWPKSVKSTYTNVKSLLLQ